MVCSADWAMRWIGSDATFAERLVAFAAVEVSKENTSVSKACVRACLSFVFICVCVCV